MKKLALISVLVIMGTCFIASAFADDFYVIPVQNKCGHCTGTLSSGGRWCDNGNQTITDMTTCLVWLKKSNWGGQKQWRNSATSGETQWDDAHTRASELHDGTIMQGLAVLRDGSVEGDWRLPTKTELDGITEGDEPVLASTPRLFVGVQSDYYWSSSSYNSTSGSAWSIGMWNGVVYDEWKIYSYYVWPVRNAK